MTRPVLLWLAQSLLATAAVIGWLSAARRAGGHGASRITRWLFPWLAIWRSGRLARIYLQGLVLGAYAVCTWLARRG